MKDTLVQNQVPLPETQTITGLLSVTSTGTAWSVPAAQFGVQSSSFSVPEPIATLEFQVVQVMSHSHVVLSPDRAQPASQAGACTTVPPTDPPSARYTTCPAGAPGPRLEAEMGVAVMNCEGETLAGEADTDTDGADDGAAPGAAELPLPHPATSQVTAAAGSTALQRERVSGVKGGTSL